MTENRRSTDSTNRSEVHRLHELKCWPGYFEAIQMGWKRFEVRNNDRDFHAGDFVNLREWDPGLGDFTGRQVRKRVGYVLRETWVGLQVGYVAFGLEEE